MVLSRDLTSEAALGEDEATARQRTCLTRRARCSATTRRGRHSALPPLTPSTVLRLSKRIQSGCAGDLQRLHKNGWHSGYLGLRSAVKSDYEQTSPRETLPSDVESDKPSESTVLRGTTPASDPPLAPPSRWPISVTMSEQARQPRTRESLSHLRRRLIVAAAVLGSVTALFVGLGTSASAGAAQAVVSSNST